MDYKNTVEKAKTLVINYKKIYLMEFINCALNT